MIVLEKKPLVKRSGIQSEGVSFGIKEDGLAHIFNVLRNQLYSNKILAVIREYSCNAFDAHVEAGKADEPFVVSVPSLLDLNFSVRDYGSGLSPDQIKEVYAFYGESTKRNSNLLVGQLGLGSKSGFAYGENFVIKSHYNGRLYTYNAYIDETKKGEICLISETETDSTGVEIVIPVKPKDIHIFIDNVRSFFKYFKVKPIVKNIPWEQIEFAWKLKTPTLSGPGWQYLTPENKWAAQNSVAVMGNVAYPINGSAIDGFPPVFNQDFVVEFEIGELEVSASRESLQFSTRTQNVIKKKFSNIIDQIKQHISEKISACKTLFEAKAIYEDLTNLNGNFYKFSSYTSSVNWNGKQIQDHHIYAPLNSRYVTIFEISKSKKSAKIVSRKMEEKAIKCTLNSRLYVDDTKNKFMSRLAHYIYNKTDNINKIYVLQFPSDQVRDEYLKETGIGISELVYTSSEPVNKIVYTYQEDSFPKEIKHSATAAFVLNLDPKLSRYHKVKSEFFIQKSFDLEKGGVYIHIDKFLCKAKYVFGSDHGFVDPLNFIRILNNKNEKFKIEFPEIACFKTETILKIKNNPKWKSLEQYVQNYIEENWADQKQLIRNHICFKKFYSDHSIKWLLLKKIDITPSILDFISKVESMILPKGDDIISDFSDVKLLDIVSNIAPSHNLDSEFNHITTRYDILNIIDSYVRDFTQIEILKKHILLIEKSLTQAEK